MDALCFGSRFVNLDITLFVSGRDLEKLSPPSARNVDSDLHLPTPVIVPSMIRPNTRR